MLHRMGPAGSSPLDSMRTDRAGSYHFTVTGRDTTAQYVVGVQYAGVAYLSGTAGPGRWSSRELDAFSVFDTSATQPIVLSQRHLLIQPANPDGSIPVLELLVLANGGTRTRVGADSTRPTWRGRLLVGGFDLEVGEGDVTRDAITHAGDSISVFAPLTPGEKQIVLTYLLPRKLAQVVLPLDEAVGTLGVMIADTMARAEPGPLKSFGIAGFENITYLRLEAKDVPAGPPLVIRLSRSPADLTDYWWVVVAGAAFAMVVGFVAWWRAERAPAALSETEVLALQVAAMDAALGERRDAASVTRRDALAVRLAAALAEKNSLS